MTSRSLYPIYEQPVQLKKVFDGLWVSTVNENVVVSEDEYFRAVELFREPTARRESYEQRDSSNQ